VGAAPGSRPAPRLADGVELLGEYQDSGYSQPPSLVRRPDGQVIQMSPLLYRVTSRIDGSRDAAAIAELVSEDLGRALSADQVRLLLTAKLLPLGVVAAPAGQGAVPVGQGAVPVGQADPAAKAAEPAPPKANPLLGLRARGTLLPERAANAAGALLRPLFHWPLVVAVIASVLAVDYWLLAVHGLGGGFQQALRDPVDLLIVLGLSVAAAVFHECGHATGCRYGGARPGVIGVGIYLIWPSFFTNVTDSYRLGRVGRLRTDLGGLYFNLIFMLALAGIYSATSAEILLLVIAITHLEMLEQLLPFARFDGYFVLSDFVGIPDLFARITPILRSAVSRGPKDPRVAGLRRRARIVVTGWVLCVIPVLTFGIGYFLLRLPVINRALWHAASRQAHLLSTAAAGHRFAVVAVDAIGVALLALSLAGSVYFTIRLARQLTTVGLRWSAGRPGRRLLFALTGLACLTALTVLWNAQGQFRGW
jgi:putative peptide zinc metalloprotease protein